VRRLRDGEAVHGGKIDPYEPASPSANGEDTALKAAAQWLRSLLVAD